MTRFARVSALVAVTLVPIALGGCITDPVTGESRVGIPVSEEAEAAQGNAYAPIFTVQYGGPYPDSALQSHCNRIVMDMARKSARPSVDWEFTILNSSVPNAFALPGGKVFMTRGLLHRMDDEAEFAVVMGHEIGHVEHRHAARQMGRTSLLQGLAAGVAIATENEAAGLGAGLGANLATLRFGRDDERESDIRGVAHSYEAGYDPREGADVFREFARMKEEAGAGETSGFEAWLSSHPIDSERIANVQKLSAQTDPRLARDGPVKGLKVSTPEWSRLMNDLRDDQAVYDRMDKALSAAAKAHKDGNDAGLRKSITALQGCANDLPNHALVLATLGMVQEAAGDTAAARASFAAASRLDQGVIEPEMGLASMGVDAADWNTGLTHSNRALRLLAGYYPATFLKAESLSGLGRTEQARAAYQEVIDTAPADSAEHKAAAKRLGLNEGGGARGARRSR